MEKEIERPEFINNNVETNNNKIQKKNVFINIEQNSTELTSIKTDIVIPIDNSDLDLGKKKESKNSKECPNKISNKNVNNYSPKNSYEYDKIINKKEDDKKSVAFPILLGKKVKHFSEENSYEKIKNNNTNNINLIKQKVPTLEHNKNIIENKSVILNKTNNNNNINICEKKEENKNSINKYYNNRKIYNNLSDIDEIELLHKTQEFRRSFFYNHFEELKKMERNLNFYFN